MTVVSKDQALSWVGALEDDINAMLSDDEDEHWDTNDEDCWKGLQLAVEKIKEYIQTH